MVNKKSGVFTASGNCGPQRKWIPHISYDLVFLKMTGKLIAKFWDNIGVEVTLDNMYIFVISTLLTLKQLQKSNL